MTFRIRHRARSPVRYIRAPGRTMRIGHEPLRRQARTVAVAPRQPRACDVKLANHARRNRLKTIVKNVGLCVPDRPPDRRRHRIG